MPASPTPAILQAIAGRFAIPGQYLGAAPHGSGHINLTYAARFAQAGAETRYILQRINRDIFRDPVQVMANVARVTGHIRAGLAASGHPDPGRRVLTLVAARDGASHVLDDRGEVWRCYRFVEGARSFDLIQGPDQAFQAARAFGAFQRQLMDYSGPRLAETIPDFHHTPRRFAALGQALTRDRHNRASGARPEIAFALAREPLSGSLLALRERGDLPERITHNDTKLNNVLFDARTGEGLCVLDLDTVMPGLSLYDFGDLLRSAANPAAEDERDLGRVQVQVAIVEALAAGYLQGTDGALLPAEREHLLLAGKLITYECGLRFLADHLDGDRYFPARRPGHNLDRCRVQFALLASLEANEDLLAARIRAL